MLILQPIQDGGKKREKSLVSCFHQQSLSELTKINALQGALITFTNTSDAHFHRSPVIDQSKSQKIGCFNPCQDPSLTKIHFWWSRVPLFLRCCGQACYHFPTKFRPLISTKHRCVDMSIQTEGMPRFGWSKQPWTEHGQSMLCCWDAITKAKATSQVETTHLCEVFFFLTCTEAFHGGKLLSVFQAYWFHKTHDTYTDLWYKRGRDNSKPFSLQLSWHVSQKGWKFDKAYSFTGGLG